MSLDCINKSETTVKMINGYNTRTGQRVDHNNMKLFLENKG